MYEISLGGVIVEKDQFWMKIASFDQTMGFSNLFGLFANLYIKSIVMSLADTMEPLL